jgi:hypothetical protein
MLIVMVMFSDAFAYPGAWVPFSVIVSSFGVLKHGARKGTRSGNPVVRIFITCVFLEHTIRCRLATVDKQ